VHNIPIIELRIRNMSEEIHSAVMVRQEEIDAHILAGVNEALSGIGAKIAQQAAEEAVEQIRRQVENYFTWGPGAKAIQAAVTKALEPIAQALQPKEE
jgi:hypothetical protein